MPFIRLSIIFNLNSDRTWAIKGWRIERILTLWIDLKLNHRTLFTHFKFNCPNFALCDNVTSWQKGSGICLTEVSWRYPQKKSKQLSTSTWILSHLFVYMVLQITRHAAINKPLHYPSTWANINFWLISFSVLSKCYEGCFWHKFPFDPKCSASVHFCNLIAIFYWVKPSHSRIS